MTLHVSTYMQKMAAAGVPMTSDQFAPRTRSEVTSDLKKMVKRGLVTKVRRGVTAYYSVSMDQLAEYENKQWKKPRPKAIATERMLANTIRNQVLSMAAQPGGVASAEIAGRTPKSVGTMAWKLAGAGLLHASREGMAKRWFTTAEARDAYAAQAVRNVPPPIPKRTSAAPRTPGVVIKAKGWGKDVAPHFPVDAQGNPLYKITVAPPFPQPTKTNTYSGAY